jgi:hypothetical protein
MHFVNQWMNFLILHQKSLLHLFALLFDSTLDHIISQNIFFPPIIYFREKEMKIRSWQIRAVSRAVDDVPTE